MLTHGPDVWRDSPSDPGEDGGGPHPDGADDGGEHLRAVHVDDAERACEHAVGRVKEGKREAENVPQPSPVMQNFPNMAKATMGQFPGYLSASTIVVASRDNAPRTRRET